MHYNCGSPYLKASRADTRINTSLSSTMHPARVVEEWQVWPCLLLESSQVPPMISRLGAGCSRLHCNCILQLPAAEDGGADLNKLLQLPLLCDVEGWPQKQRAGHKQHVTADMQGVRHNHIKWGSITRGSQAVSHKLVNVQAMLALPPAA